MSEQASSPIHGPAPRGDRESEPSSEPIRVAMIIQSYHPRVGGAERQVQALAPLLRERGVETHVLTRRYPGLLLHEVVDGTPVHRLPVPGPKAVASLCFTIGAIPLIGRLRPAVLHAHELLSPATAAMAAQTLFGTPVVAKVLRGGLLGDLWKLRSGPLGGWRMRLLARHVDAFISISREIDRELDSIGVPAARRVSIPNGVDTSRFAPLPEPQKRARRAALGLDEGPAVVFAGRLAPEKRVDRLLRIWPSVRLEHPRAVLLILGDGEEAESLQRLSSPGVRFLGSVGDVETYLQAADLSVLASETEGLSNALLEAMAAGLPVVATRVGGAEDLIEHGTSGWLLSSQSEEELKSAVLTLLADESRRHALARQARERISRHFALPLVASRLRSLYDDVRARRDSFRGRGNS